MASNASPHAQAQQISARLKTFTNNELKNICREEGLPVSGVKTALQSRLLNFVDERLRRGEFEAINRLHTRTLPPGRAPPPNAYATPASAYPNHTSPTYPSPYEMPHGYGRSVAHPPAPRFQQKVQFKESPFYEIVEQLAPSLTLEITPNHRTSASQKVQLNADICNQLKEEESDMRVMIFCAVEQPLGQFTRADIAFPAQVEVRVNGDEVKANFKGLKNKPGSTRPADITSFVRKSPHTYLNGLHITYALTQKASESRRSSEKYIVAVNLVRKHKVDDLVRRIERRSIIPKQRVIDEMLRKAEDPDIVFSSTVMSLKDPISTLRITTPCRSAVCNHNRCFDATCFLQLQEQAPTWQCPICNKTVSFEALAVDQYVQEILHAVPSSTEQVTIEPNGKWSHGNDSDNKASRNGGANYDDESDDDLVEIPASRVTNIKSEAISTPISLSRTPPLSSREASSAPRSGNKRTSEVIDLTFSDDDEPPRPAKKVAYNTPSSLPDPSRNGHRAPSFSSSSALHSRPQSQAPNGTHPLRLDLRPQQHSGYSNYRPPQPPSSYPNHGSSSYSAYSSSP